MGLVDFFLMMIDASQAGGQSLASMNAALEDCGFEIFVNCHIVNMLVSVDVSDFRN